MPSRSATTLPYTELEVATGNFDTTRKPIDRIIIHTMVGTAASAATLFDTQPQNRPNKLPSAAHYGVKLDGSIIHWLEETFTAYHAGDYPMNQRSIGIEHEDNGDYNGIRTDALYMSSAKLVRDICLFYQIPIDRQHILKHSEVHATGCPDALDIDRIVREAQATQNEQALIDDLRKARDLNWTKYQEEVRVNNDLKKQYQDEQEKNQGLREALDNLTKADADTGSQLLDVQHRRADYIGYLNKVSATLALPTFDDYTQLQVDGILAQIHQLNTSHDELVKEVVPTMDELARAAIFKRSQKAKSLLDRIISFFKRS